MIDLETFCRFCGLLEHPTGVFAGEPFVLERWQEQIMGEVLRPREDGSPAWTTTVIVVPRKNGKTTLLAAYALARLVLDDDSPEVLLAAASDRQAGRLFDAAHGMVARSPFLLARLAVQEYRGRIYRKDGLGQILRMSSRPESLHGYSPSLMLVDELAQWRQPMLRRSWAALTTALGARAFGQTIAISTAGLAAERSTSILGTLIDGNERDGLVERPHEGLTISRNRPARTIVFNYAAPTTNPEDIAAVKSANPASWITEDYLAAQAASPEIATSEFLQLHACRWVTPAEGWLDAEILDAAAVSDRYVEAGAKIAIGFDGSRGGTHGSDATVLVACTLGDDPYLWLLGQWQRPDDLARGEEWYVPVEQVTTEVTRACTRYRVRALYADPANWWSEIGEWRRRHRSAGVVEFPQRPSKMGPAIDRFATDLRAGALSWDGHQVLRTHLLNARFEPARGDSGGGRLVKHGRSEYDRIDGAVAAVLAYQARADALESGRGRSAAFHSF